MRTLKKQIKGKTAIDLIIYMAAIVAPIMTVPQVYKIWSGKRVEGVSIETWGTYTIISLAWVFYGLRIKAKPVILTNGLLFLVDALVVIGVLFYR